MLLRLAEIWLQSRENIFAFKLIKQGNVINVLQDLW
jgi:hypothetical protein